MFCWAATACGTTCSTRRLTRCASLWCTRDCQAAPWPPKSRALSRSTRRPTLTTSPVCRRFTRATIASGAAAPAAVPAVFGCRYKQRWFVVIGGGGGCDATIAVDAPRREASPTTSLLLLPLLPTAASFRGCCQQQQALGRQRGHVAHCRPKCCSKLAARGGASFTCTSVISTKARQHLTQFSEA